jgi:hypothetical protein
MDMSRAATTPTSAELEQMHDRYRQGGALRARAPHVIYVDASCPHRDCAQHLQAIDFRLEAFGRAVHDVLVKAWWDDVGFAGRCPTCGRWTHFTIRSKRAISDEQAAVLPQLPPNWASEAVIL